MDPRGAISRRVASARDTFRSELWPLPALSVVASVVLGVVLPRLDAQIDDNLSATTRGYLFGGGADAARVILGSITGSLITLTSLTFSLTVVTLQLASGQFSPRLLRTFVQDRFVHVTLSMFLSTFVYSLTVLREVRTATDTQAQFVPQISVTVAFALTLASVMALVLFLAHLAREIRVETMLRRVHSEGEATLQRVLPEYDASRSAVTLPPVPPYAVPLVAGSSGFMTGLAEEAVLEAAVTADAIVLVEVTPGCSMVAGTPIAFAWPRSGASALHDDHLEALQACLAGAVKVRFEHTSAQNITFALRQLTDVADKALSPGINDPTTAIHALGHSSGLLCSAVDRDLGLWELRDKHDVVRVTLCRPDLADLLEIAVGGPRRYGATDPDVLTRIYRLLRELAFTTSQPSHREIIRSQLARLSGTVAKQDFDDTERALLQHEHHAVETALEGVCRPTSA